MRGNIVVANLYGRADDGSSRAVRVDAQGSMLASPAPVDVTPFAAPAAIPVLTPLVAWTPFADTAAALIFGMKVDAAATDGATFIIEGSEDGVTPAKSYAMQFALLAGEHEVYVTPMPILVRYWRMSVQPTNAGPTRVAWNLRRVPR